MKQRYLFIILILFIFNLSAHGQWYFRQHEVYSVDELTLYQLHKSLNRSYVGIGGGVVITSIGFLSTLGGIVGNDISKDINHGIGQDLTESFSEGVVITGVFVLIGGIIMLITHSNRIKIIKGAPNYKSREVGEISLTPTISFNNATRSYSPGLSFSIYF